MRLTDRKRLAILEAATDEFRTQGYDATSMDGIAAAAGVSKRTVYNHFESKDVLFEAILLQLWACSGEQVKLGFDPDRPLREQLQELLRQKLHSTRDENVAALTRVAVGFALHNPERARAMTERMGQGEQGIAAWVRGAVAHGALDVEDPDFATEQLHALVKGFSFWPQLLLGMPPLSEAEGEHLVTETAEMFLARYAREHK